MLFQVVDFASEQVYSHTLRTLLDDHSNVVTMLAEGFSECRRHIQVGLSTNS